MTKKIVIDPITRIEGHLRAEIEVDEDGVVKDAYVSGQLFRGIEMILKGRDPRDAGLLAGRICGVCTNSHFRAAVTSVEDAYSLKLPKNAEIIRDLMAMALFIQDHVVHFYHLHSLDFVDVTTALKADPKATSKEAHKYTQKPFRNSHSHYEAVLEKLGNFVKAGKLGPFSNGYWGHVDYKLTPEQNLIMISHYLEALKFQTNISKAVAIFGGKTPHPQSIVVGGVTSVADMLNPQRLNDYLFIIKEAKDFIERAYLPDAKLLSIAYRDEVKAGIGRANGNFLSVGGYEFEGERKLFCDGVIYNHDFETIEDFDETKITEEVDRAWYKDKMNGNVREGTLGYDEVHYTDLNEDGSLKTAKNSDKYSWVKAPRYNGKTMESGPLARVLISYTKDNTLIKSFVDEFLKETDLELMDLSTTVGRNAARAIETNYICEYIFKLVSRLIQNIKYYDTDTWVKFDFNSLEKEAKGRAFFEVPRGVLSHFINIKNARIENFSVIAPTTWNATPRNFDGLRGAYEEALVGLKIEDTSKPLEVLRVLHSFDPCLACAVHVIDADGKELSRCKIKT
ncbi:nickel-dependent hydrogenase large subunit [Sulfurimonas autotrophica]|uniref:Nickel-dependent hydrogenase large subunit n=1 Tax=Sulfurimonas autotrophica (strain ATCC BAA-671 / DSM 16294 / JCM 11897 / OK10) TaxID=563040 RepID=E0UTJ2_SULAO|nr:nickel-dependent hydrogenase large subunit [Sulfurimonas autotrophica]ADN09357.1 nickel-dependent hydrogenase large subunit [Sulfurimonas autotrophica DSM 16294]